MEGQRDEYNGCRHRGGYEPQGWMHIAIEEPEQDTGKGKVAHKWKILAEEYGDRITELTSKGKSIEDISNITGLSEYYVKNLHESTIKMRKTKGELS